MDIFDETKLKLAGLWEDERERQNAKMVLSQAIASASDLPAKTVYEIFDELDRLLLDTDEQDTRQKNPHL